MEPTQYGGVIGDLIDKIKDRFSPDENREDSTDTFLEVLRKLLLEFVNENASLDTETLIELATLAGKRGYDIVIRPLDIPYVPNRIVEPLVDDFLRDRIVPPVVKTVVLTLKGE